MWGGGCQQGIGLQKTLCISLNYKRAHCIAPPSLKKGLWFSEIPYLPQGLGEGISKGWSDTFSHPRYLTDWVEYLHTAFTWKRHFIFNKQWAHGKGQVCNIDRENFLIVWNASSQLPHKVWEGGRVPTFAQKPPWHTLKVMLDPLKKICSKYGWLVHWGKKLTLLKGFPLLQKQNQRQKI